MSTVASTLRQRTVRSLTWQLLGVGGQQGVAFAQSVVLAHVLLKEDIGLAIKVGAVIAGVEALTAFTGEQSQIWSARGTERSYLDTVFTIRLLRGLLLAAGLAALSPVFAWFFHAERYQDHLWLTGLFLALSGNSLLDALQSPARATRIKAMDFRRVAAGDFGGALLGTGGAVVLAFWLRDAWAIVLGQLLQTALRSSVSYLVAPYRPHVRLERESLRELRKYTLGAAGVPFLMMLIMQAPFLVLGKISHDATVAIYGLGEKLAKLPDVIFLRVLSPVALPAYSELKRDLPGLRAAWLGAIRAFLLFGLPLTITLAWIGDALPGFVYGADYGGVHGLFTLLSLTGGIAGLTAVTGPLFWAIGEPYKDRVAQLFRCLTIYGLGIPLAFQDHAVGFAAAAATAAAVALVFLIVYAVRRLQVSMREFFAASSAGLLIGGGMLAFLLLIDAVHEPHGKWRILVGVGIGGPLMLWILLTRLLGWRGSRATGANVEPGV